MREKPSVLVDKDSCGLVLGAEGVQLEIRYPKPEFSFLRSVAGITTPVAYLVLQSWTHGIAMIAMLRTVAQGGQWTGSKSRGPSHFCGQAKRIFGDCSSCSWVVVYMG